MAPESYEAANPETTPYSDQGRFDNGPLHSLDMENQIDTSVDIPYLSERLAVFNQKLDVDWMPEGSHPLKGRYHFGGHEFIHKDSKDPQRLIEELPDRTLRHHVYFSRGISSDVVNDTVSKLPVTDQRSGDIEHEEPTIEPIEHWGVGHLISDSENGPWTEMEPIVIHGVIDQPQMCAPSVHYSEGTFHMVIQSACFVDNYPIYHLTSSNGTDFHVRRKLLEPIYGTSESGVYDVDIIDDDGKFFVAYSAMTPMNGVHKAVNEIHLAYIPSLDGTEEAERLVKLDDELWVRVVKLGEDKFGYYALDDTSNASRIIRTEDGTIMRLSPGDNDSIGIDVLEGGSWIPSGMNQSPDIDNYGYLPSRLPGSPILNHTEIPIHNTHPPIRQADESEEQRIERERIEENFEWGLEGMQLVRLPNGLYALLGVCFLSDEPIGSRQRAFIAVSKKITGPFTPLGLLVDPANDSGWGDGENGHASAKIIGDNLYILYQARKPFRNDTPHNEKLAARWQLGEVVCSLNELCKVAEMLVHDLQDMPEPAM